MNKQIEIIFQSNNNNKHKIFFLIISEVEIFKLV